MADALAIINTETLNREEGADGVNDQQAIPPTEDPAEHPEDEHPEDSNRDADRLNEDEVEPVIKKSRFGLEKGHVPKKEDEGKKKLDEGKKKETQSL